MSIYDREYMRGQGEKKSALSDFFGRISAVKALIIINVAIFVIGAFVDRFFGYGTFFSMFDLSLPGLASGKIWTVITYSFLHAGLAHIAFNMIALYFMGTPLESWIGSRKFLFVYFAGALAGAALWLLFSFGSPVGLVGASASLCIGETLGLLMLLSHFFRKRALLRLGLRVVRWEDLKKFVVNGFGVGSAFIFQAIVMFTFNILLLASGDGNGVTYVAIFGVMYTMSTIPAAIFDGAGNAISTVVSIFAGEKDSASILTTMRQGLKIVVAGGILVAAIFALKAPALIRFFGITDQTALDLAVPAVRVYVGCFLFMGVNVLATAFWQAIGRARLAGGMSIARNFVLMLALGMALISQMQIVGLSLTYVITEALCLIGVVVIHGVSSSNRYTEQKYASTGQAFEKVYTISTDSITEIANDLEQVCDQWEIDYKKAFFIHLIVE